jgi:hypothetical protein
LFYDLAPAKVVSGVVRCQHGSRLGLTWLPAAGLLILAIIADVLHYIAKIDDLFVQMCDYQPA